MEELERRVLTLIEVSKRLDKMENSLDLLLLTINSNFTKDGKENNTRNSKESSKRSVPGNRN